MSKNILILEDDFGINQLLTSELKSHGFNIIQSFDGEEAINKFNPHIDLAILDIMVPKIDGIEVMKYIRENSNMPILFLTAKDDEIDKIRTLGLGADDYITKPFSMIEVLYRIKAQLRRYYDYNHQQKRQTIIQYKDLVLNSETHTLKKGDVFIELSIKEFELLEVLMSSVGQVFTKHQLYEQIWQEEYYGDDNTVMVHISKLREKIGDSSKKPTYIKTIKGLGYRMEKL